jgi:nucleoid DNA-binding protein
MAARKKASKKKSVKKGSAKRKVVKRSASAKSAVKKAGPVSVGRKAYSKSQFVMELATQTGVARKDVVAVLETVSRIIGAHLQKSGPEIFSWPGLFKIVVVKKPATKARKGINPFTGESMMFKAKPASRRVKVRPLKQLKSMAG